MTESKKVHIATSICEARRKFNEICGGEYGSSVTMWNEEKIMRNDEVHAACKMCGIHGETNYIHVRYHPESYVTVAYGLDSPDGGASNGFTAEIYVDHKGNFICSKCKYRTT